MNALKQSGLSLTALASAMLLAGCLGGGGGSSSSASSTVPVSGTASKGYLKNAAVSAYCGKSATPLVTGDTGTDGSYTLAVPTGCADPIRIEVKPKASGTTMYNEVTRESNEPVTDTTLVLRTYMPSLVAKSDAYITPFTEMQASLLDSVTTLAAKDVETAKQNLSKVLGNGDEAAGLALLNAKPVMNLTASSTPEEQKLAVALVGVMQEAGTAAKMKTALDTMKAELKKDITMSAAGVVALPATPTASLLQKLNTNITTALADTAVKAAVQGAAPADAISSVQSTIAAAVAAPVAITPTQVTADQAKEATTLAPKISAAKSMFETLKADLLALWDPTKDSLGAPMGFLNAKTEAMRADFSSIQGAGTNIPLYLSVIQRAVYDLNGAPDGFLGTYQYYPVSSDTKGSYHVIPLYWMGINSDGACKVYTTGEYATQPASVRCYWIDPSSRVSAQITAGPIEGTLYRYRDVLVVLSKDASNGTVTWKTTRRQWIRDLNTMVWSHELLDADSSGNLTLTGTIAASSSSTPTSATGEATVKGKWVPAIAGEKETNVDLTLAGNVTGTSSSTTQSGSGSISVKGSLSSGPVTLSILDTSNISIADANITAASTTSAVGSSVAGKLSAKLALRADTTAFRYEGVVDYSISGSGADAGMTGNAESSFTGTISTLSKTVATPFFEGKLGTSTTMKENVVTADKSTVSGTVSNAAKVYKIAGSATGTTSDKPKTLAFTYTNPSSKTLTLTGTSGTATTAKALSITDGTTTVTLDEASKGDIKAGDAKLGTFDKRKATFTDGSYVYVM